MQLQNGADAAAYGAATLEARALNFTAYTNRAMAANEVAIGQMVGILSFADELKTSGQYIDTYAGILEIATSWLFAIITVGDVIEGIITAIVEILEDIGDVIEDVGEGAEQVMAAIATPVTFGLTTVNQVYSYSQEIYHSVTIVLVTSNILKSLEDNVPGTTPFNILNMFDKNKPGARLSDFGLLALVGHLPSYLNTHTKRYSASKQKKPHNKPGKDSRQIKKDKKRIAREKKKIENDRKKIAEIQKQISKAAKKEARDKAKLAKAERQYKKDKANCDKEQNDTKHGKCNQKLQKEKKKINKLKKLVEQDRKKVDKLKSKLHNANIKLKKDKKDLAAAEKKLQDDSKKGHGSANEENEGMQRMAATIREARDPFSSGGPPVWDKDIFGLDYKYYNRDWEFGFGFDKNLHVGPLHFGHLKLFLGLDSKGGSEVRHKGNSYVWSAIDTAVLEAELVIMGIPIDPAIPAGGGGYQATNGNEKDILTPLDLPPTLGAYGKPKAYGSAGYPYGRWVAWEGAALELEENEVPGSPYGGLRAYRDINDQPKDDSSFTLPFAAPFFMVGVIRSYDDIHKNDPKFAGKLNLINEHPETDLVGAIAKSELYFKRPQDLSYFLRSDKKNELPNVFSPFWQARLVKTTDFDRFLAMAIQHKKIWLPKHEAEEIPGMKGLIAQLEKILKLF